MLIHHRFNILNVKIYFGFETHYKKIKNYILSFTEIRDKIYIHTIWYSVSLLKGKYLMNTSSL